MRLIGIILLALVLSTSTASAVDKVRKATIEVDGKEYTFPIAIGKQDDVYMLLKAKEGDKVALDMFMQGLEERLFYIGDNFAIWLIVRKDGSMEIL